MKDFDARPVADDMRSRRAFVRRIAYTAPLLLTLPAAPALAQFGSGQVTDCNNPALFPVFDEDGRFLFCGS